MFSCPCWSPEFHWDRGTAACVCSHTHRQPKVLVTHGHQQPSSRPRVDTVPKGCLFPPCPQHGPQSRMSLERGSPLPLQAPLGALFRALPGEALT